MDTTSEGSDLKASELIQEFSRAAKGEPAIARQAEGEPVKNKDVPVPQLVPKGVTVRRMAHAHAITDAPQQGQTVQEALQKKMHEKFNKAADRRQSDRRSQDRDQHDLGR